MLGSEFVWQLQQKDYRLIQKVYCVQNYLKIIKKYFHHNHIEQDIIAVKSKFGVLL